MALDSLDFLDELEMKEAAASESDKKHVFAAASSGWKKGFFAGSDKKKDKNSAQKKSNSDNKASLSPSVPKEDTKPSTVIATSTASAEIVDQKQLKTNEQTPDRTSDDQLQQPPKPVAFTGVIKERF